MSNDLRNNVSLNTNEIKQEETKQNASEKGENKDISPPETGSKQWKELYRAIADYAKGLQK